MKTTEQQIEQEIAKLYDATIGCNEADQVRENLKKIAELKEKLIQAQKH